MSGYHPASMAGEPVPPAEVREALDRVLGSATFQGASRSSLLLRFIVDETLADRTDRLKDYTLGAEALGRGDEFDPRLDPIARVEASRLRSRLERYYAGEGTTDPLIISLPKGGYVPLFTPRPPALSPLPSRSASRWARAAVPLLLATLIVMVAALAAFIVLGRHNPPHAPEVRLELTTPPTTDPVSLAISPDGRTVAFVASGGQTARLWIRPLASSTARPLTGTDNASLPFWAPDSRSIGFFADGVIKRIDIATGVVKVITTALVPAGASWNADDAVVYTVVPDGPLFRTTASGDARTPVTTLVDGQTGHRAPWFLPDGRRFLFYATGRADVRGIYLGTLGSRSIVRLADADSPAVFAPPDALLYVDRSALVARRFDLARGVFTSEPVRVADDIAVDAASGIPALSASAVGSIVYRSGSSGGKRQFVWFDRAGQPTARLGDAEIAGPGYPSLSTDGRQALLQRTTAGNTDIWMLDAHRGTAVRFTSEPGPDIGAVWSPKGDRIVYSAQQDGAFQVFEKPARGGDRTLLLKTPESKQATDWSRDGRFLLFRTVVVAPVLNMDIWALPLDGSQPFPVVQTPFEERDAQFSPDGRWVAYESNESGRDEIYVQPFPPPGERTRISLDGGAQVRWRADGRELFYLTLDDELTTVPIATSADGKTLRAGTPAPLFHAPVGSLLGASLHEYAVSSDGRRFLLDTVIEEPTAPIEVMLNWKVGGE